MFCQEMGIILAVHSNPSKTPSNLSIDPSRYAVWASHCLFGTSRGNILCGEEQEDHHKKLGMPALPCLTQRIPSPEIDNPTNGGRMITVALDTTHDSQDSPPSILYPHELPSATPSEYAQSLWLSISIGHSQLQDPQKDRKLGNLENMWKTSSTTSTPSWKHQYQYLFGATYTYNDIQFHISS